MPVMLASTTGKGRLACAASVVVRINNKNSVRMNFTIEAHIYKVRFVIVLGRWMLSPPYQSKAAST